MTDLPQRLYLSATDGSRTGADVDVCIRDLETRYDLLQYEVDGWCVWPTLRFVLALQLQRLHTTLQKGQPNQFRQVLSALRHVPGFLKLRRSTYVAVVHASNRSEKVKGRYKDIFFDDLLIDLPDCFKIEHMDNRTFAARGKQALIRSDMISSPFLVLAKMLARIYSPPDVILTGQKMSRCLREALGDESLSEISIIRQLTLFYWSKMLFRWLFQQMSPRYLLIVTAYCDWALIAAAKESRVDVIEFQHGFLDRYHTGYTWSAYALPYRAKMPIPDRIFLYGDYWKSQLEPYGFWGDALRSVGSLRIDQYRSACHEKYTCPTIVITNQRVDDEKISAFLAEFLALVRGTMNLHVYIKLHPAEHNKDLFTIAFANEKNVRVLFSAEEPSTFELIARSHLHISISSTCHYEALGLRTPTAILPFTTHEAVLHLYHEGHAILLDSPQALVEAVRHLATLVVPEHIGNSYFRSGAVAHMRRELGL